METQEPSTSAEPRVAGGVAFPPDGWLTNRETAQRLGVGLATLTCNTWKWRPILRATARTVRIPTGGRINLYPVELVGRLVAERDAAKEGPAMPEGFVDKDGACARFGVTRHVWKTWVRQGKVRFGRRDATNLGGRRTLYAVADLERLRDELFGDDVLYKAADGVYHVPAGLLRREEAWARFGVGKPTWERWEREGQIVGGACVPGGPKLYRVEAIERLVEANGRLAPPYPDPARPDVVRVPLGGYRMKRREAIVDADALPLIEGGHCHWSKAGDAGHVALSRGGTHEPLRRVVMGVSDGAINVRHVNGDPLDCRRANLVLRTVVQRTRNMRKVRAINGRLPTSRFKGVHWETQTKGWRARIGMDGKTRQLGRFRDELAAAQAYDDAARELFGEHARLNFPDGVDAWLEREAAPARGAA